MKLIQLVPMEPTLGGRLSRAAAVALFLGVTAVGLLASWALPRQDRLAAERHARLRSTPGTVTRADVRAYDERRKRQGRRQWWEVEVWYTFEVDGRQQVGVAASFSHRATEFGTASEAQDFAARHPAGKVVTVWYDRAHPEDSALDPAYVPAGFLAPWALAIAFAAFALALWIAHRTVQEARARPLPPSERYRGLRIVAFTLAVAAVSMSGLLSAHLVPWAWHRWRQRTLVSGAVYLHGDMDVDYRPVTPVVRYSFRPDVAQPTLFVDGDAWRFGRADVGSEEEARAIRARIGEDYRADRLVVHFDTRDPTFNALSLEYGPLLSARSASLAGLALAVSLVALLRLGPAMSRLRKSWPRE
jgi:hypothetical protein